MGNNDVIGAFSQDAASRLTGLSIGQLREWDRDGFLQPSYGQENRHLPYGRIYSFRGIASLRVLGELRKAHKVSLQHLKKVSRQLADLGDAKWTATTLHVLNKRVVFDDPRTGERREIAAASACSISR